MRGPVTLAGLALTGLVLAGCVNPPATQTSPIASPESPTATPVTSSASAPVSPSVTPTLTKAEKQAKAAEAKVLEYLALFDQLFADPSRSINELYDVSRGQVQEDTANTIRRARNRGYVGNGGLRGTPLSTKAKGPGKWVVTVCTDSSGLQTVDKNGDPLPAASGAPEQLKVQMQVEKAKDNGRLYVVTDDVVATSC